MRLEERKGESLSELKVALDLQQKGSVSTRPEPDGIDSPTAHLEARDGRLPEFPLVLARALEVLDKAIAKHLAGDAPLGAETLGRRPEVGRELREVLGRDVRVADGAIGQRELLLDAPLTERKDGRQGIIRVDIGSRDANLNCRKATRLA